MSEPLKILVLGASYGSLLATKLLLAGHNVTLVCLPAEAQLINKEGTRVRMPGIWCSNAARSRRLLCEKLPSARL